MPSADEKIIAFGRKLFGDGEYTVHVSAVEAELRNAAGETVFRAADLGTKPDHRAALLRHLRRRAGGDAG